ncbi:ornithine cyclodeaminase family protein [Pseudomaricurvus alkylphenolicus]|uniref:ornithine cyclodeaminase family protein n=1 Tax=Pseudomaricurvus alkylphenolicus TaxID=1306991 RepID=UPI001423591A|nr:ornithine cyclodeaminase family protein [Pseudomaricurvus alkylphenolicus]NIB38452.1 ornithine cyclodeaminase family protein [Pseudomaricurvus alkylphenolicus]
MYYVSESVVEELVTQEAITDAVKDSFCALAKEAAECFPIVRESLNYADAVFGFKSGFDRRAPVLGVKAGGLWPGNASRGLANHQSTVVLFDEDSGEPTALVRATYLTALRTAAASALSIRYLAREDARVLGIVGAGGQGAFQLSAALRERDFDLVLICDPNPDKIMTLATQAINCGCAARPATPEELTAADVIITVTPSRRPILQQDWVTPGTHLACMGADTVGKQEVDELLVARASIFGDLAEQAALLGECQHAFNAGLIQKADITTLGAVIEGFHAGRVSDNEITLFDSTGMALQDLAAARVVVDAAKAAERIIELD